MKYFYLYKITNALNGKVYIGQSVNPKARWRRHKSDAKLGKDKKHLANAIRKYGVKNFSFEVIAQAKTLEDIDWSEIECIKQHKSSDKKYGYNIALGGNGKRVVSEETKRKLSKINTGKKESQKTKDRKSKSMRGKNSGTKNGMFGKRSPRAKLTIGQANNIRRQYKLNSKTLLELAHEYKVSKKTILNIIHDKIYRE